MFKDVFELVNYVTFDKDVVKSPAVQVARVETKYRRESHEFETAYEQEVSPMPVAGSDR